MYATVVVLIVVLMMFAAILAGAATMRSSQISQREEDWLIDPEAVTWTQNGPVTRGARTKTRYVR